MKVVGMAECHIETVAKPRFTRLAQIDNILFEEIEIGEILHRQIGIKTFVINGLYTFLFANSSGLRHKIVGGVTVNVVGMCETLIDRIIGYIVRRKAVEKEVVTFIDLTVATVMQLDRNFLEIVDALGGIGFGKHCASITENS